MGKTQIPLVQVPLLMANRTENNGKLLRRPQPRKLQPLRNCLTPDSSPEPDYDSPTEDQLAAEQKDAVDDWLLSASIDTHMPAGHTTPNDPPPTVRRYRPSLEPQSQQEQTSRESNQQVKQELAEAYLSMVKSQPMPTASAKVLLRTTVHTGPQGLPPPKPRKPRTVIPYEAITEKGPSEKAHLNTLNLGVTANNDASLRVNEFIREVAEGMEISEENVETVMFSRSNFKQLTQMVHEQLSLESNRKTGKITRKNLNQQISQQDLPYRPSSHAVTGSRVPQTQILIQMASMLTEQIQATAEGRNIRALIRPFPKWTPSKPIDEMPRAEIILYEHAEEEEEDHQQLVIRGEAQETSGVIMRHTSEKHFMDSRRNRTPFDFSGDAGLDPTDIAVLDALVTGGAVLSLKAHFIEMMPDVSPITNTLRYLNLSFNNFTMIPPEVFSLTHLEVLKLRNNPISEIPDEIRHLRYLRTFEIPFCLISDIPKGLLTLKQLQYLDVSYNKLTSLPDKIRRLQSLQVLFVEGNQLVALPCACLAIPNLRYIRVRNNFMHPIFWPEYMKDNDVPQSLRDLSGLLMKQLELDLRYGSKLPKTAKAILNTGKTCDCCDGPVVGKGLTLIRPGSIYGVKNVPFLFKSCSHYCAKLFMQNKDNLADHVFSDRGTIDG